MSIVDINDKVKNKESSLKEDKESCSIHSGDLYQKKVVTVSA